MIIETGSITTAGKEGRGEPTDGNEKRRDVPTSKLERNR